MKYTWIQEHSQEFPVAAMCQVLTVSRSGYYAWHKRPASTSQVRREALMVRIRQMHAQTRGVYGSPRIHRELVATEIQVCQNTVAKLMTQAGLRAKTSRKFAVCTTGSNHHHPVAENLLDQNFACELLNQIWCCDITYIPTDEGWLYLAAVLDLCSRKIVGWAVTEHLRAELCEQALAMVPGRRQPQAGLLRHSDRGVQHACGTYQALPAENDMTCSMSRRGNCYDNAAMESFFGSLKTELVHHEHDATRDAARRSIFEYIEVFYNRKRRHGALGYLSTEAFEASLN